MASPKITLPLATGSAHLQAHEVDRKNCLSKWEDETCFPLKTTPGLAVDYQNRRARVENLSRKEGERFLNFFADQAPALNIEKEEAWGLLEMKKGETERVVWIEIGYDEAPEGVSADGVALSDAQFQLEAEGWNMTALYFYHIHHKLKGNAELDVYPFSSADLNSVFLLVPLSRQRFSYIGENRVVTPVGVYALRWNEQQWESRDQYFDRFDKGIKWYRENEEKLVARCFTPGRDLVEASGCFAIGANTLMAAHAWPIAISFIPAQDQ